MFRYIVTISLLVVLLYCSIGKIEGQWIIEAVYNDDNCMSAPYYALQKSGNCFYGIQIETCDPNENYVQVQNYPYNACSGTPTEYTIATNQCSRNTTTYCQDTYSISQGQFVTETYESYTCNDQNDIFQVSVQPVKTCSASMIALCNTTHVTLRYYADVNCNKFEFENYVSLGCSIQDSYGTNVYCT
ncbi:hypothetical protein DLAC_06454 [Tieghemostelium lacteum]|uniref:Uncharacterized protein n=1 Tax=Tieghemostelium lacteum TaxID=361077 RepID=A0A151ZEY4_TIELA|nr:hypothetical protein DLAC_06454 [Tieghemostelium lacteum]|eukprot:KYQ92470.1 hypothetical protein DLAC_06454 [Tieghemostelium lacteum]